MGQDLLAHLFRLCLGVSYDQIDVKALLISQVEVYHGADHFFPSCREGSYRRKHSCYLSSTPSYGVGTRYPDATGYSAMPPIGVYVTNFDVARSVSVHDYHP
jgi:hypothetical protein